MSAIKNFTDEISDQFLVCKICYQTYDKPKTLSCLHVFCTSCLEKYLQAELERTQYRYVIYARCVTCPICRKRTEISSGGIRALPDNFLVSNLTELVNRSKPVARNPMCDFCSNSGYSKVAHSRCVECAKNMCQRCTDLHRKTRVTRNHSIFDVKAEKSVVCKVHLDEPLRFFCQPCETCICVACTFHEHHGHEVSSFGDGIQKYAGDMEAMINLCSSKIATIQSQLNVINRFEAAMNRVEEHIKTQASNLIVNVRLKQRLLLEEIRQFYGSEALEVLDNREELEQILDNLSTTCDLAQFVLKDRNLELLLLHKEVREKMKTLIDCDLPDLPETMFKELKFVQGAMLFGYLDSGQEVRHLEYDIKPSPLLPPEILARLAITSSIEETQTSQDEFLCDVGTTMNSDMVAGLPSASSQTEEPVRLFRRGCTQTEQTKMISTGTEMEGPIFRSRYQNTERRDSILANCASQTNVELVEAMSECHPVLSTNGVKTSDAGTGTNVKTSTVACDTGITMATSETTTEDLETELINRYLEMLDNDEPHSPPYNIPFPVDIFDRHSPTSETMPILTHILNSAQKVDKGTNVPTITDITGGREIEFLDVMVKDSSTSTDDLLPKFTNNPLYSYSDSYEESSPEDYTDSSDSNCRSSDEEKTDQATLIDKDDLIQLLAGEELVNWDERSALHDMIVLDRLNQHRNIDYIDTCMNTESIPLASRSVMTDAPGSRTVATITVANITCDAATNARMRRPRRETIGTLTDLIRYSDTASDAYGPETVDFGNLVKPETRDMETEWQDVLVHSLSRDSDFVSGPESPSRDVPERKNSLETSHLTEKLEGLFSMSKLQQLTQRLEKRPSQTAGLVSAVTRKLERQLSGDNFDEVALDAATTIKGKKPVRRWSTSSAMSKSDDADIDRLRSRRTFENLQTNRHSPNPRSPVLRASKDVKIHPSPPASPKLKTQPQGVSGNSSPHAPRLSSAYRSKTFSHFQQVKPDLEAHYHTDPETTTKPSLARRKQLARVRKPDITALLSLNTMPVGDWGPVLPPPNTSFSTTRKYRLTSHYSTPQEYSEMGAEPISVASQSRRDISSDSSFESSSDISSSFDEDGTPILTPFTDDSQSNDDNDERSGTATPTAEFNIEVRPDDVGSKDAVIDVREVRPDAAGFAGESIIDSESVDMTETSRERADTLTNEMFVEDIPDSSQEIDHKVTIDTPSLQSSTDDTKTIRANDFEFDSLSPLERSIDLKRQETKEDDSSVNEGFLSPLRGLTSKCHTANRISVDSDNFEEIEKMVEAESCRNSPDSPPAVQVTDVTTEMVEPELIAREEAGCVMSIPQTVLVKDTVTTSLDEVVLESIAPRIEIESPSPANSADQRIISPEIDSHVNLTNTGELDPFIIEYEGNSPMLSPQMPPQISPRSPNRMKRFTFEELPSLSESEALDSPQNYRSLSPRPKMGKMASKKTDSQMRRAGVDEPPRVVLGVSGIGAIPRSKSLNTITAKEKSVDRPDKKTLSKTFQSLFKSKSKDSKSKRKSSFM